MFQNVHQCSTPPSFSDFIWSWFLGKSSQNSRAEKSGEKRRKKKSPLVSIFSPLKRIDKSDNKWSSFWGSWWSKWSVLDQKNTAEKKRRRFFFSGVSPPFSAWDFWDHLPRNHDQTKAEKIFFVNTWVRASYGQVAFSRRIQNAWETLYKNSFCVLNGQVGQVS